MNKIMAPLFIIIIYGCILRLVAYFDILKISIWILPLIELFFGFILGTYLLDRKRNSNAWVMKVLISSILVVSLLYRVNWLPIQIEIPNNLFILIYIWCGWSFFRE